MIARGAAFFGNTDHTARRNSVQADGGFNVSKKVIRNIHHNRNISDHTRAARKKISTNSLKSTKQLEEDAYFRGQNSNSNIDHLVSPKKSLRKENSYKPAVTYTPKINKIECDYKLADYKIESHNQSILDEDSQESSANTFISKFSNIPEFKLQHDGRSKKSFELDKEGSFAQRIKTVNTMKKVKNLLTTKTLGEHSKFIFGQKSKFSSGWNFFETKQQEFLYGKYNFNTVLQCSVSLISISSAILGYDISYNPSTEKGVIKDSENSKTANFFLWISFLSSILLWLLIIFEYLIHCKLLFHFKRISETLWRSEPNNLCKLMFTLLLFAPHPNPIFKGITIELFNTKYSVINYYSLNSFMGILSMLRCWYFVKFYLVNSEFHSARIQRVCEMNNFDTNLEFSMKASMIKTPYILYFILFFSILACCSFSLRVFERELDMYTKEYFVSYWNTIWCLIITMTTVGYGDYYPSTFFGRLIGIISSIFGVFLISMLVVTVTNVLLLEETDRNVFLLIERIYMMEEKDILAAKLVSRYVKLMKLMKNKKTPTEQKERLRDQTLMSLIKFREKCNEIDSTYPPYSHFDEILVNLSRIDNNLDDLTNRLSELVNEN
jgi:hypothetical protein